jgi:hypothetical protein
LDDTPQTCTGGTFTPSPGLSEGSHTFKVAATDPAGNEDTSPAQRTFFVDRGAPSAALTSSPSAVTNAPHFAFTFSDSLTTPTAVCSVDGGAVSNCKTGPTSGSYDPAAAPRSLSDGPHQFKLEVIDEANNRTTVTKTFQYDGTAPETSASTPPALTADNRVTITYSSPDTSAAFECSLDSAPFTACGSSSSKTYNGLPDGAHTFRVRAFDAAGNKDATPEQRSFTVDTTAPETVIAAAPTGPSNAPRFSFGSDDPGAQFACRIDGAPFASCPAEGYSPAGLEDGSHVLDVRAQDAAGNFDATPASQAFEVDGTAPTVTLGGLKKSTTDTTPSVRITASEAVSGFECSVDGKKAKPCGARYTLKRLKPGKHRIAVTATDLAGNEGTAQAGFRVKPKRKP